MYKEVFKIRTYGKRKELGLTQGQVATDTEIVQSKISKYETGDLEPNLETLGKLANFYEVSIDWLLGNPHGGKEGNLIKAALEELFTDVIDTFKGAEEQGFIKCDELDSFLHDIEKRKDAIIERYSEA